MSRHSASNKVVDLKKDVNKTYECLFDHYDCDDSNLEIRERYNQGGNSEYRRQCLKCGQSRGNAVPKNSIVGSPPLWDIKLERNHEAQQLKTRELKRAARESARKERFEEKRDWYNQEYLKSEKWRGKANLVMERARGLCEGCRIKPADEVHHTTYEHIGDEFLFELVALCSSCHRRFHNAQMDKAAQGHRV